MMKADLIDANELSLDLRQKWRAMLQASPAYDSPFLTSAFAMAVAKQRPDARIAVFHEGGAEIGFLPVHVRGGGFLRPIGAPFSDWHGPVLSARAEFEPSVALKACRASAIRFTGLVDPYERFARLGRIARPSWLIDLNGGEAAYRTALQAVQAKHLNNTRRCERKAEREIGPVRFTFHSEQQETLETLLNWKRRQFNETGRHDVLAPSWCRALLHDLFEAPGEIGVVLSTLHFGDRVAAIEYYLRAGSLLHAWIASYDRDLASYAPGHILTDKMISAADAQGVKRIDFGVGNDSYKSKWCLQTRPSQEVVVYAASPAGHARASATHAVQAVAPMVGVGEDLSERLRRRLDQIVATDVTWLRAAASMMRTGSSLGQAPRASLELGKRTG